jgi:hypothetical protein
LISAERGREIRRVFETSSVSGTEDFLKGREKKLLKAF